MKYVHCSPKSDTNKMLLLKGCNCVFEVGALDFFQYGMKVLQGSHIIVASLWSFKLWICSLSEEEFSYQELKLVLNSLVLHNLIDIQIGIHFLGLSVLTGAGKGNMIQLLHIIKSLAVKLFRVFLDTWQARNNQWRCLKVGERTWPSATYSNRALFINYLRLV